MKLSVHFVTSIILAIVLYPFYGWLSLVVIISSFLIDADHYAWYVIKKRDFSFIRTKQYSTGSEHYENMLHIFHTVEFFVLCAVLAFYSDVAFVFFIGLLVHQVIDVIHMYRINALFNDVRASSVIEWAVREIARWHKRKMHKNRV